jgi:ATP-dependent 26S proteasome regulatory subunit
MDALLNTLDGVDTKGKEIITVFTTNHIETINPAILRMGRVDTCVRVDPPDASAAVKLVQKYGRGLINSQTNFNEVGKKLAGRIPAFIREVTERAKIAAIARLKGGNITGKVLEADIMAAAIAMEPHADLLKGRGDEKKGGPEVFIKLPESKIPEARELLQTLGLPVAVGMNGDGE